MALDPRRRQKKLERKRAKQRVKNKVVAYCAPGELALRLDRYAAAPVLHSVAADVIWTQGLGNVLLSRELSSGDVAFGVFLVDMGCLGVKNAFCNVTSRHRYERDLYAKMFSDYQPISLTPECARKLVEGAVAYAQDLGFSPHPDYRRARLIFGDIDAAACPREFVYGRDGKPFFTSGPYDDAARCKHVLATLHARCGEGNYNYIVGGLGLEMLSEITGILPEDIERQALESE